MIVAVSEGGDEAVLVMMMTTGGQAQRHAVVIVLHLISSFRDGHNHHLYSLNMRLITA